MKVAELRKKSLDELNQMLKDIYKEKLNLRMSRGVQQNPKPHLFRKARLGVARIKTIIAEKGGIQ